MQQASLGFRDDDVREDHPEVHHPPAPLRAPQKLLVCVVPRIGVLHDPVFGGVQGRGSAPLWEISAMRLRLSRRSRVASEPQPRSRWTVALLPPASQASGRPVLDGIKETLQDPFDGETNREAGPGGPGTRQCRAMPPETFSAERYAGGRAEARSVDMPGSRQEWGLSGRRARAERVEFRPSSAPGGDPAPEGGQDPAGEDSALRRATREPSSRRAPRRAAPCRRGARPPRYPKKCPHKKARSRTSKERLSRSPDEQLLRLESAKLGERS